jgi:hypothetical protein
MRTANISGRDEIVEVEEIVGGGGNVGGSSSKLVQREDGLVDGQPNPITAEDYGVTMIANYLRQRVSEQSAYDAQIAAAQATTDLLDGVTVTTPAEFDTLFPTPQITTPS